MDRELPFSHRNDPVTSYASADSMREIARVHRSRILAVLTSASTPLAAEQIAEAVGLTTLQVMKRLSELLNTRTIERAPGIYRNRSRRPACFYQVTRRMQG